MFRYILTEKDKLKGCIFYLQWYIFRNDNQNHLSHTKLTRNSFFNACKVICHVLLCFFVVM